MELLGEVLVDGVDGEVRSPEADPLDNRVGEIGLEVADDDVRGADVDLEANELGAPDACYHEKPKAAAGWTGQRCRGRCDLTTEVVRQIHGEAGGQKPGDLEVEILGESGVVGSPKLVRVAALDHPLPRRSDQQSGEKPVDRDDEMDPANDDTAVASGTGHSDQKARPSTHGCPVRRLRHNPAPANGGCRRSSARSSGSSIARSLATRAAEII